MGELLELALPDAETGAPPPAWDAAGEYRAALCDVYYRAHAAAPLARQEDAWTDAALAGAAAAAAGEGAASWTAAVGDDDEEAVYVRVPAAAPLMLPLVQRDCVVADCPALYVVPRAGAYARRLRERAAGRGGIKTLRVPALPPPPSD